MRKVLSALILVTLMLVTLTGCKGKAGDIVEKQDPNIHQNLGNPEVGETAEGAAWRDTVIASPIIAEVEHMGTKYQVHAKDSLRYIYNTETTELYSGSSVTYVKGAVLKDWVSAHEKAELRKDEALFDTTWEYTSTRARSLIGYCDEAYSLITRARTSEYLEYIYKDKKDDTHYRIAITDDYILFAPLAFSYVFDVSVY